ncbi:MAG TPA: PilZ domain-containing protein [Terriglobales bacterium]|nr:PilZ domain-containing protein [Terriglobales bacterium]
MKEAASGSGADKSHRNERRYPRCAVDMRILVVAFRDGNNTTVWGRSNEIGEDGMSATLTGDLVPGEVVSMEFTLPVSTEPMKLRAVVRYRSGFRHGFEFLTLKDGQREKIQRALHLLPGDI